MYDSIQRQDILLKNLVTCHDLWEQANSDLVRGNHQEFFKALDTQIGPISLHCSIHEVATYVDAGIQKLKQM